jgi:hypothetical protein
MCRGAHHVLPYQTVQWESHPLRRCEARSDHLPLVLPFSARERVELDRGLATLRLWRARHAYIHLERAEAREEHSDQERSAWGCQCGPVVVRSWLRVEGGQVGRDWRGRSHQGVASEVPRVGCQSIDQILYNTKCKARPRNLQCLIGCAPAQ